MKLSSSGGDSSYQPFPITKWDLISSNRVVGQRIPKNPQLSQIIAEAIVCSPQTDRKTLLLNTMPMQLIEYREVKVAA